MKGVILFLVPDLFCLYVMAIFPAAYNDATFFRALGWGFFELFLLLQCRKYKIMIKPSVLGTAGSESSYCCGFLHGTCFSEKLM